MTGHSLDADRKRVTDAGFDHHLVKPVDALEKSVAEAPPRHAAVP